MSEVIAFLERMGSNPSSVSFSDDGYEAAVSSLKIDSVQSKALLARDAMALAKGLDARAQMICMILVPDEGEDSEPNDG